MSLHGFLPSLDWIREESGTAGDGAKMHPASPENGRRQYTPGGRPCKWNCTNGSPIPGFALIRERSAAQMRCDFRSLVVGIFPLHRRAESSGDFFPGCRANGRDVIADGLLDLGWRESVHDQSDKLRLLPPCVDASTGGNRHLKQIAPLGAVRANRNRKPLQF